MAIAVAYPTTGRGIIKVLQIILGVFACATLCYGKFASSDDYCISEPRLAYVSVLSFVFVIANAVFFVLSLFDVSVYEFERVYSIVGLILFMVAFGIAIWADISSGGDDRVIAATMLTGIQMLLFGCDLKILQSEGEAKKPYISV